MSDPERAAEMANWSALRDASLDRLEAYLDAMFAADIADDADESLRVTLDSAVDFWWQLISEPKPAYRDDLPLVTEVTLVLVPRETPQLRQQRALSLMFGLPVLFSSVAASRRRDSVVVVSPIDCSLGVETRITDDTTQEFDVARRPERLTTECYELQSYSKTSLQRYAERLRKLRAPLLASDLLKFCRSRDHLRAVLLFNNSVVSASSRSDRRRPRNIRRLPQKQEQPDDNPSGPART